jgi:ubiquinone/menaquinone biosynthesis C-methylase UbiE
MEQTRVTIMDGADRVMNVADAHRLDNPERLKWLPPDRVLELLPPCPAATVADIGAGTGYFAIPLAQAIGPDGKVFAIDLQPEMLDLLRKKIEGPGSPRNISLLQGTAESTTLPPVSCDLVFIANVWHELPDHAAALREFRRVLRPDGALAIVDWRPDAEHPPGPPIKHRIDAAEVGRKLEKRRWTVVGNTSVGSYSYFILARPKAG